MHAKLIQSCLTPCDPMNCSPPGSSVHGIPQARILEWVAISFSRGSSWLRDRTVSLSLLHWQVGSLSLVPPGKPIWHIADCIKHYNKVIIKVPWEYGEGKIEIRIMEGRSLNWEFELDLKELVGLIGVFKNKMHLSWVQRFRWQPLWYSFIALRHIEKLEPFSLNLVICEAFLVPPWALLNITFSLISFPRAGNLRIKWKLKMVWEWQCR